MPKEYRIDAKKNVELQFNQALQDIVIRRTAERIREKVTKDIDREMGKIFQQLANWLTNQRSNSASAPEQLKPYLPTPWIAYAPKYRSAKRRRTGHSKWFIHGFPSATTRQDEEQLHEELSNIDSYDVANVVGKSQAVVRRDKSGVTIKMLPSARFSINKFENRFDDYLSEIAMYKLQNRKKRYRALVGPAFAHFLDQRIPEIVTNSLRKL